ncbi:hypothetical protein ACLBYD_26575 [Rhodococcus sp. C26F]
MARTDGQGELRSGSGASSTTRHETITPAPADSIGSSMSDAHPGQVVGDGASTVAQSRHFQMTSFPDRVVRLWA